jgi:RHS repeat-associated protein
LFYDPHQLAPMVMLAAPGGTANFSYNHVDRQGSVAVVSDYTGNNILARYAYLPYGDSNPPDIAACLNNGTSSSDCGSPAGTSFGYDGYRYDPETGLYHTGARYYDPRLGRFLQPDPIGQAGGVNLYAYTGNDPLNGTDPDGLWQATISGGYLGVGGSFTFGYNSGQWNLGAWLGVGAGISARINPFDTGASTPGLNLSARGQANYSLGTTGGGFGLQASSTTGTQTYNGSFSLGLGTNVSGSISSTGDVHFAPTLGVGSSAYLGVGGTWTSAPAQTPATAPSSPSSTIVPTPAATSTSVASQPVGVASTGPGK